MASAPSGLQELNHPPAVLQEPQQIRIYFDEPLVHRQRCLAWVNLEATFARAVMREAAAAAAAEARAWCREGEVDSTGAGPSSRSEAGPGRNLS